MAYDVNSFLDSIKSTLVASTTALSASLTTSYSVATDSVMIGDPKRLTRQVDQYPAIIITPKTKGQEWDEIGLNSAGNMARQVTIGVDILCLTQCPSDSEDADRQARTLARNVETILEKNIEKQASTSSVSDGWHTCMVTNAQYDGAYTESNQTYQASVLLSTEFKTFGYR